MDTAKRMDFLQAARTNDAFRREVMTGTHEQVVVMTLPPGAEIGEEVHPATDQLPCTGRRKRPMRQKADAG